MTDVDASCATRGRVLDQVRDEPGLTKSDLCNRMGLGWGTVYHHVEQLQGSGLVEILYEGGCTRVFAPEIPVEERRLIASLRKEYSETIVHALSRNGGHQMCHLSQEMGLSRKVLRNHLVPLSESGALEKEGGRRPRYWATENALRMIRHLNRR